MDETISKFIAETKTYLRSKQAVGAAFGEVRDHIMRDVEEIQENAAKERPNIPEVDYGAVQSGSIPAGTTEAIRKAGAAIIRGVFPKSQAEDWNAELGEYIASNDYLTKAEEKAGLDKYFSSLEAGAPQIYGLYWSKPQVMARQAETMAQTKRFLNSLWDVRGPMGDEFDPNNDYSYADRTRRRQPGDTTLGLSPMMIVQ